MIITAPVTDYIPASVLTTNGDLVLRGAAVPQRLAAGGANLALQGQGAGVIPVYDYVNKVREVNGNILNWITIDIGNWDMNAAFSVDVAHGLTHGKIRTVFATIRSDDDLTHYDLAGNHDVVDPNNLTQHLKWDATNIQLSRDNDGPFDSVSFDTGVYNRGWITISYID